MRCLVCGFKRLTFQHELALDKGRTGPYSTLVSETRKVIQYGSHEFSMSGVLR